MHLQRRFHWPEYIGRSEVLVRFSDSAQAQIAITQKFDRFPVHGLALCAHVRSHPLCSSTPTLHSDHSIPLPRLTSISGLAHAHMHICQSATAMPGLSIRGTPLSLPPVFRTPIPSQTGILDLTGIPTPRHRSSPPHRTAFEDNAAFPTPHAPRSSVFVPSSPAGVAAPCRFSTAGHRDPSSMQAQADNAIDAYLPPSKTLQTYRGPLRWSCVPLLREKQRELWETSSEK